MKNTLLNFSRVFVGLLFIFSGLIKANDPLGFGYKLQEYFEVFNVGFLNPVATGLAIILCTLEIVLGVLLILGVYARKVAWGLLLVILFFTILTFVSAFFKVVTSCGCFGDAIPLTPWQSFGKDVILLIFIGYIFVNKHQINSIFKSNKIQKVIATSTVILATAFGLFTYSYLPILDFLPYKKGTNLPSLMVIPPGEKPDEYQFSYNLKNKVTGEEKKLTDKQYLEAEIWIDTNWVIVGDSERKLIKKGYEPKIKDLFINDASGTNYTKEIIENPFYNLIFVAYDLDAANENAISKLNALAFDATEQFNIRTVLLTSNSPEDAEAFSKKFNLFSEIFYADAIPLKSMVRANPGIILMKNGIVINKWHFNNMPSFKFLADTYFGK